MGNYNKVWNCWQELNILVARHIPHFNRSAKSSKMASGEMPLSGTKHFPRFYRRIFIKHFWNCQTIVLFYTAEILFFMDRFKININIYKAYPCLAILFITYRTQFLFLFSDVETQSIRTINTSIPWLCQCTCAFKDRLLTGHTRLRRARVGPVIVTQARVTAVNTVEAFSHHVHLAIVCTNLESSKKCIETSVTNKSKIQYRSRW